MSNGAMMHTNAFLSGAASRHADVAAANANAAISWRNHANELEASLNEWKAYAGKLEAQVRSWQADAVKSEAVARTSAEVSRMMNDGAGPRTVIGADTFDALWAKKVEEVCKEWGVSLPADSN